MHNANEVIGIAVDLDAGSLTFYKNSSGLCQDGVLIRTMDLATDDAKPYRFASEVTGNALGTYIGVNFGQQPFVHTPPAGYEGLYQTWEEYARSSLGYALDRNCVS